MPARLDQIDLDGVVVVEEKKVRRAVVSSLVALSFVALSLVGAPMTAVAASDTGHATSDAGMGVAAVFANIFYIPAKVVYGVVGGVTGGLAYGLTGGNKEVADSIWVPSLGGDYVVTPTQLQGGAPIYFSGLSERELATRQANRETEAATRGADAELEPAANPETDAPASDIF